jgi:hypothetical protein
MKERGKSANVVRQVFFFLFETMPNEVNRLVAVICWSQWESVDWKSKGILLGDEGELERWVGENQVMKRQAASNEAASQQQGSQQTAIQPAISEAASLHPQSPKNETLNQLQDVDIPPIWKQRKTKKSSCYQKFILSL